MQTYRPGQAPATYDNHWLQQELRNIYKAANQPSDAALLRTLNIAPDRNNDGELRIADGTNWNPRTGYGLHFYSSTDEEWKQVLHIGAGGAITQSSTKATTVTLSKNTGEITLNNAALAAATIVSFTLTNTTLLAGDVLILNHVSGGTLGAYTLNASCAAGSAVIYVRNATAGSLSEAPVIRFTRIPGATS